MERRSFGIGALIILGLIIGFAIKKLAVGLLLGLVIGLVLMKSFSAKK